jgi:hypothetical protein
VLPKELNSGQVAVLESLLKAGFRFVTFERFGRYLGVEKDGFVALLETAGGKVQVFGQVGYHVREGRKQKAVSRKGHEPHPIGSPKQLLAAAFFIRLAFQSHPRRRRESVQVSSLVDGS